MFDRIVEQRDADDVWRGAVSFAATASLAGAAVVGFVVGSLIWFAAPPPPTDEVVSIAMIEPQGGGDQPTLPALPRTQAPSRSTEPNPDAEPATDPAPAPSSAAQQQGTGSSPDAGTGGGTGGGTTNRPGTSDGDPEPASHFVILPHENLVVKRKIEPRYPESAKALNLGEQRCVATVRVDVDGVPYEVDFDRCPEAFQDETREALFKWRWYPARDGHERIAAQTTVSVVYRLDP